MGKTFVPNLPDSLSLPGTHMVEGKNQLPQLSSRLYMCTYGTGRERRQGEGGGGREGEGEREGGRKRGRKAGREGWGRVGWGRVGER